MVWLSIFLIVFFTVFWWIRLSEFHKQPMLPDPKAKMAVDIGALIILALYEITLFKYVRNISGEFPAIFLIIGCIGGFFLLGSWVIYDINKQKRILDKREFRDEEPM